LKKNPITIEEYKTKNKLIFSSSGTNIMLAIVDRIFNLISKKDFNKIIFASFIEINKFQLKLEQNKYERDELTKCE
jgi:hypothetical protein